MAAVPMPIVMGMVAGVFLRFGTDLVHAMRDDLAIAGPMVLAFLLASVWPRKWLPPIIVALLVGVVAVALSGRFDPGPAFHAVAGRPGLAGPGVVGAGPRSSWWCRSPSRCWWCRTGRASPCSAPRGHDPPVNVITIACGVWSLLAATVGAVSTCLTGPTNALLSASGERARQYTAGVCCGLLAIGFGLFAPVFTRLMLAAPAAFIAVLAGLAMLRVLQAAFVTAFAHAVLAGRARHVRGDRRRRVGVQHRRRLLGARRRARRLGAVGAVGLHSRN